VGAWADRICGVCALSLWPIASRRWGVLCGFLRQPTAAGPCMMCLWDLPKRQWGFFGGHLYACRLLIDTRFKFVYFLSDLCVCWELMNYEPVFVCMCMGDNEQFMFVSWHVVDVCASVCEPLIELSVSPDQ
jgi:hypothetical protein